MTVITLSTTHLAASGVSSGWVAAWAAVALAVGAVLRWLYERFAKKAQKHAQEPANELTAMGKTAEAVARASASLIGPFQEALRQNALDIGEQRGKLEEQHGKIEALEQREAKCQAKLKEFAEILGIDPNGD